MIKLLRFGRFFGPESKKNIVFQFNIDEKMEGWNMGIGNSDPCNEICEFNRKIKILGSMLEKILDFRSIVH